MEDHDLVAAAEDHDSAAATKEKLPCAGDSITRGDRSPAAAVLAELGGSAPVIADALRARPDLTPEQVRATWEHFQRRIADGRCDEGAFFGAIRRGELHAAPPAPIPVNDAAADEQALHAAYLRVRALAPPGLSHAVTAELIYAITDGATDEQVLDLLAQLQAGGGP